MTSGWHTIALGQLCSIKSGKSDTKDAVNDGEYAFFDRSRTIKKSTRYLYDCEALIIPGEGTEFLPRHFIGKFDLHQRAYALFDFSNRINVRFLYNFLHHKSEYFPQVAVGATVKSLRLRHFEQLPVSLTTVPEQRRIVGILDEAFDGIATAKANAEKNLRNARFLFESHLQSVFSHRGEGWVERRLGDMATFRNGINFTKSSRGDSVKIVGVKDFQNNFWAPLDNLESVVTDGSLSDSDKLKENDLLFVRSNGNMQLIGRCLLVGAVAEKITHSGFTIRARLNGSGLSPKYLSHFLKSHNAKRKMIDSGIGTNIKSLNQVTLSALVIPFPYPAGQARVVDQLEALRIETQHLDAIYQQKLAVLDALKKSLLHQAFTGQL